MCQKNRKTGILNDRICDAAENPLTHSRMTISAHDDQIGVDVQGMSAESLVDLMAATRNDVDRCLHTVTCQEGGDIRPRFLAHRVGRGLRIDKYNMDIFGADQHIHRLPHRLSGFQPGVPGDQHGFWRKLDLFA